MSHKAIIDTEYPSLAVVAQRYGLDASKLRTELTRFASVRDLASRERRHATNTRTRPAARLVGKNSKRTRARRLARGSAVRLTRLKTFKKIIAKLGSVARGKSATTARLAGRNPQSGDVIRVLAGGRRGGKRKAARKQAEAARAAG